MKNPKLSIIIPVYNGEKTLKNCLNSILNQNFKNFELIIINNNSSDNTKSIIGKFIRKNSKIKYFFEKKQGIGNARYKGERNAKGEIILMTDCDCIAPKNWAKEIIKAFSNKKIIAVQGEIKSLEKNYWADNIDNEKERIAKERVKDNCPGIIDTANFAIRKNVLKKIGFSNSQVKYSNDLELEIRLKSKNYKIDFKPIKIFHLHKNNFLQIFLKWAKRGEEFGRIISEYNPSKLPCTKKDFSNLRFFTNIILELITLKRTFLYNFTTGIAWRIGKLAYQIKTHR
jgi:glycosyltransferase involved in cell wall biosynthesis